MSPEQEAARGPEARRCEALLRHDSEAVLVLDAQGNIVFESGAVPDLLGRELGARLGANAFDRLHPQDRDWLSAVFRNVVATPLGRATVRFRVQHYLDERWVEVEANVRNHLHDPDIAGVVCRAIDIGQRVAEERAAEASVHRLRSLVHRTADIVAILDREGHVLFESDAVQRILGRPPLALGPQPVWVEFHPDDVPAAQEGMAWLLENPGADRRVTFRVKHAVEDRWVHLESVATNMLDDPAVRGIVCNVRDITAEIAAESAIRASEQRFRSLVRNVTDLFTVLDQQGRIGFVNAAATRILGYPEGALLGRLVWELLHPDELAGTMQNFARLLDDPEGGVVRAVVRLRHADHATWVPLEMRGQNFLADPHIGGIIWVGSDITERRQAEENLQASERRFRSLVQNSSDVVALLRPDGVITYMSEAVRPVMGRAPEEFVHQPGLQFVHPEDREEVRARFRRFASGEESHRVVFRVQRADGAWRWMEVKGNHRLADPDVGALVINARDITERREAEEAVAARDRHLAALTELQRLLLEPVPLRPRLDRLLGIMAATMQADRMLFFDGATGSDGETMLELAGEWCAPEVASVRRPGGLRMKLSRYRDEIRTTLAAGATWEGRAAELPEQERVALERADARVVLAAPVIVRGVLRGIFTLHRTRSDESWTRLEQDHVLSAARSFALALGNEAARTALDDETDRLRVTLGSIADAVIATDALGCITLANPVAERMLGWSESELRGRALTSLFEVRPPQPGDLSPPHPRGLGSDAVARALSTGETLHSHRHVWGLRKDGSSFHTASSTAPIRSASGTIVGVVRVFRDISIEDRMQAERVKIEKYEGLSVIAAGIAHDFNNILTAVLGNISDAINLIEGGDPALLTRLGEAERAAIRARDLTAQLLTFTKGGAPLKHLARVEEIIAESTRFALHGSNIRAELNLPPALPAIEADSGQISQVVHNIVLNAKQAMPGGGRLSVGAGVREVGLHDARGIRAGRYVEMTFRDEGSGIPPEVLPKVFDPFFTTKEGGTGLGLATAYGIVHKHGGYISVDSTPGRGATFRILLPASESAPPVRQQTRRLPPPTQRIRNGVRVLVMDDDDHVRRVAGIMIHGLGYDVESAADEATAVQMFQTAREAGRPFDIAVLDLTMPGGPGGLVVVKQLRAVDPQLLTLACSGYLTDEIRANYVELGFSAILAKPYRAHEMAAALEALLEQRKQRVVKI
ncbi:MAG: PAS domain S-box protein [Verrucomicrobia bacterium]|nr:PAS domain S-box protein [Verrucomicrobiota bacterium]